MVSNPADGAENLLQRLAGLYGDGDPATAHAGHSMRELATGMRADSESVWRPEYAAARHLHAGAADLHAESEDLVHAPVAEIRAGTTTAGRDAFTNLLADHRDGTAALALIGDTRFGATAGLGHADHTITRAVDRVNVDVDQARRLAAQIEAAIRAETSRDADTLPDATPPMVDVAESRGAYLVEKAQRQASQLVDAAQQQGGPPAFLDMASTRAAYLVEKAQRQAAEMVDAAQQQAAQGH